MDRSEQAVDEFPPADYRGATWMSCYANGHASAGSVRRHSIFIPLYHFHSLETEQDFMDVISPNQRGNSVNSGSATQ